MAVDRTPQKQEAEAFKKQADELRTDLQAGYSFVEGSRYTDTAAAYTVEEAMDRYIERVSGKPPFRPSTLDRLKTMRAKLVAAVEKAKRISPEAFAASRKDDNVNTRG